MYEDIIEDILNLQESCEEAQKQDVEIQESSKETEKRNVKQQILFDFDLVDNVDKGNNNVENFPNCPGPSAMEIEPKIHHGNVSENIFEVKIQNSSTESANSEVIDIPDSDEDEIFVESTKNLSNKIVGNDSDKQSMFINDKSQDELEVIGESNNDKGKEDNRDIIYTKTVSGIKKWDNPIPGCSKNSDNIFPRLNDDLITDELLKDTRLIQALLPQFTYYFIYKILFNNRLAKNRIELTLWDLLPINRPQPQILRKRKYMDEVCSVECKQSPDISLQKDKADTMIIVEEQRERSVTVGDIEKLEDKTVAPSNTENNETNISTPDTTVSNNDVDQSTFVSQPINATKIKLIKRKQQVKTKSIDKLNKQLSIAAKCAKDDNNTDRIVQDSNKFSSLETDSKTEELQKSELKKEPALFPNSTVKPSIATVLQPAKLTLDRKSAPNLQMHFKTIPILSPAKLHLPKIIDSMQLPVPNNNIHILENVNLELDGSPKVLTSKRSSNNKEASRIDNVSQLFGLDSRRPAIPLQDALDLSRNMDTRGMENVNVHDKLVVGVKGVSSEPFYNLPSTSAETAQNVADQTPTSSVACNFVNYNFNQKPNDVSTSQISNRGDEQQHLGLEEIIYNTVSKIKQEETVENAVKDPKKIMLSERANGIFIKLMSMFPSIKTIYIKKLCLKYTTNDYEQLRDDMVMERIIDILLNTQENEKLKPLPVIEKSNQTYDMNEQYADLLMIFPEADPMYLRKIAEEINGDQERMKEFVQLKLENPDYPTRAQSQEKKKLTDQQKQYTTNFKVEQFLEIFPDPFSYFENDKRTCQFKPIAIDFLKYYFSKIRVNTLIKEYSKYMNNLSLTAKALEMLNPDLKNKRVCNKSIVTYITILTEDIPFLQECAFIQHKVEIKRYLDEMKTKEEQEFNELKMKNELLECQCCYDNECMPSKCSTCEDGHIFCNLCIIRSTDVVLGDGNTRVDCLLKCGCEFPISVLQRVLPPTKFSILLCKRQEAEVMAAGVEGLVSCPFCHFASIPPLEDKIFKCLNPECMKESCRLCKELNHIPLKCNERKTESARLYLEERMTEALVRKCYRCSRMFFKEEGCNKMTCPCGAQMCYICDKPVTNYNHFQGQGAERSNLCPLWSDDRRLNAETVIKVGQDTFQKIKDKDPGININVDALLPKLPPKSKGPHNDIAQNIMVNRNARQFPL